MGVDRYGVSYARDWGLLLIVGLACLTFGGLLGYMAAGRLAEKFAGQLRDCEAQLDRRPK